MGAGSLPQRGDHHQPRAGGLAGPGPPDRRRRAEPGRGRRSTPTTCSPRIPAAQARRERRSFGELLDWLDGHPLAMRLTLPRLDTTDPADLLAGLQGTTPLPAADDPDAGRTTSLPASITYSFAHLSGQTRRLLPAVSLFHGVADEDVLMAFSAVEGVPDRFAGVSKQEWTAVLEDAARVGLLTGLGAGMYQIHPALPGYLAAGWHAEDPAGYSPGAGGVRAGPVHRLRRLQPVADRADRIRERRPRLRHHRAAAADPGRDARPRPGPPRVGRSRAALSGRWMRTGTPAASARKPPPGPTASWTPPPAPARTPPETRRRRCGCTPPSARPPGRRTPGSRTRPRKPTGRPSPTCRTSPKPNGPAATSPSSTTSSA